MKQIVDTFLQGQMIYGKWGNGIYDLKQKIQQDFFSATYQASDLIRGENCLLKIAYHHSDLQREYQITQIMQNNLIGKHNIFLPKVYDIDDFAYKGRTFYFMVKECLLEQDDSSNFLDKINLEANDVLFVGLNFCRFMQKLLEKGYLWPNLDLKEILYTPVKKQIVLQNLSGCLCVGDGIRCFSKLYDRAYWGAGARSSDESYAVFVFAMFLCSLVSGERFLRVKRTLESVIELLPVLIPRQRKLRKIIEKGLQNGYQTFEEIDKDIFEAIGSQDMPAFS